MKHWLIHYQQQLSQQITAGILPHALLLSGLAGTGKKPLAEWLVRVLLCQQLKNNADDPVLTPCGQCKLCLLYAGKTYPDHLHLTPDGKSIGVDEVRRVSQFLEKTAQLGTNKTVIVDQAEKMTTAAANALLKTLEEPMANNTIILITSDADVLIPTIISRCRIINIRPPVGDALLAYYAIAGHDKFSNISQLPELSDHVIAEHYQQFCDKLFLYLATGQGLSYLTGQLLENAHAFRWLEKVLANLMRTQHYWQNAGNVTVGQHTELISRLSKNKLWQSYQRLLSSSKQLKLLSQANNQFVFEKLLIDIFTIISVQEE